MRNVLGLLAVIVLLASCGSNTPPLPPRPLPVVETVKQDTAQQDSIPTIVLSEPTIKDVNIDINVSDTLTSINAEDGTSFVRFDGTKDITTILIKVDKKHKKIKQVQINGYDLIGEAIVNHKVPLKLISSNKVLVLEGASLNLVSRYYDVPMTQLMWCNDIDNKNYIQAGTILKLNCNNEK